MDKLADLKQRAKNAGAGTLILRGVKDALISFEFENETKEFPLTLELDGKMLFVATFENVDDNTRIGIES